MDVWKVKEFNALCHEVGLDEARIYSNSLSFRWSAARYHKQNIQQKISDLKIETFPQTVADYTSQFDFELDALMLVLSSIFDMMGQLLNECFVRPKLSTDDVKFDEVVNHGCIPVELKSILEPIKGNALYRKIKAYANVSKHKYVIQGTNQVDFTKMPTEVSYETEFEYKSGEWHKLTLDTAFECYKFVGKSVIKIGTKTQELLGK